MTGEVVSVVDWFVSDKGTKFVKEFIKISNGEIGTVAREASKAHKVGDRVNFTLKTNNEGKFVVTLL